MKSKKEEAKFRSLWTGCGLFGENYTKEFVCKGCSSSGAWIFVSFTIWWYEISSRGAYLHLLMTAARFRCCVSVANKSTRILVLAHTNMIDLRGRWVRRKGGKVAIDLIMRVVMMRKKHMVWKGTMASSSKHSCQRKMMTQKLPAEQIVDKCNVAKRPGTGSHSLNHAYGIDNYPR